MIYSPVFVILVAIIWPLFFAFLCLAFLLGVSRERHLWEVRVRHLLSEIERKKAEKAAGAQARRKKREAS
jgi:hypothetical protein